MFYDFCYRNDVLKGSELGMLHVLMNSHTAGEYENQIAREDAAYVRKYTKYMLNLFKKQAST